MRFGLTQILPDLGPHTSHPSSITSGGPLFDLRRDRKGRRNVLQVTDRMPPYGVGQNQCDQIWQNLAILAKF